MAHSGVGETGATFAKFGHVPRELSCGRMTTHAEEQERRAKTRHSEEAKTRRFCRTEGFAAAMMI